MKQTSSAIASRLGACRLACLLVRDAQDEDWVASCIEPHCLFLGILAHLRVRLVTLLARRTLRRGRCQGQNQNSDDTFHGAPQLSLAIRLKARAVSPSEPGSIAHLSDRLTDSAKTQAYPQSGPCKYRLSSFARLVAGSEARINRSPKMWSKGFSDIELRL